MYVTPLQSADGSLSVARIRRLAQTTSGALMVSASTLLDRAAAAAE